MHVSIITKYPAMLDSFGQESFALDCSCLIRKVLDNLSVPGLAANIVHI